LKCDGTRAETRFHLSPKRTCPIKSAGASVYSITGSRGVRISGSNGSNAGYTTFRGSVKSTGCPLLSPVSPSLPLPCVTVCHHISAGLYIFLSAQKHSDGCGAYTAFTLVLGGCSPAVKLVHSPSLQGMSERNSSLTLTTCPGAALRVAVRFLTWICLTRGGYRISRSYTSALHHTHRISYTLHLTPYILHLTPYVLHLTPYVLHLTSYSLHLTSYTLCHIVSYSVSCDMYTSCV
jgi:hypothetical protein